LRIRHCTLQQGSKKGRNRFGKYPFAVDMKYNILPDDGGDSACPPCRPALRAIDDGLPISYLGKAEVAGGMIAAAPTGHLRGGTVIKKLKTFLPAVPLRGLEAGVFKKSNFFIVVMNPR
jgi:hypothetical protein